MDFQALNMKKQLKYLSYLSCLCRMEFLRKLAGKTLQCALQIASCDFYRIFKQVISFDGALQLPQMLAVRASWII